MGQDIVPMDLRTISLSTWKLLLALALVSPPAQADGRGLSPALATIAPARKQSSSSTKTPEKKMKVETDVTPLSKYVESTRPEFEARLKELVDLPSVSADPARKQNLLKTAEARGARPQ